MEIHNRIDFGRYRIVKCMDGKPLKLTLVKKEEYEDKDYDLYEVCKVIENEEGKKERVKMYNETFTKRELHKFYNDPTYYIAVSPDEFEGGKE